MAVVDEFLRANNDYASHFSRGTCPFLLHEEVAVLACMDARLDPARILGLEEVTPTLSVTQADGKRSRAFTGHLGATPWDRGHCYSAPHGLWHAHIYRRDDPPENSAGSDANADDIALMPFADLEQSVRDDITYLKNSPLIPDTTTIRGFIYDVKSGRLHEVVLSTRTYSPVYHGNRLHVHHDSFHDTEPMISLSLLPSNTSAKSMLHCSVEWVHLQQVESARSLLAPGQWKAVA